MVEKEQKPTPGQHQRLQVDAKSEQMQPKSSGDVAQPESGPPTDTRKCFVTTSKGSKLLLFVSPTMDVKHIMTEVAKRHNAQFKELGRVKCKFLAYCQTAEDQQGFKLTNEMLLQEFASDSNEVHLVAYTEDATVPAKRPAATDSDGQPPKKAKSASGAGAASGNGTTPGEAPKKRGRPTNKERAEKEAAAAAQVAAQVKPAADDKGKAPASAQMASAAKPAAAKPLAAKPATAPVKKETKPKPQAVQATPAEQKQPAKAPAKTPATATAPTPAATKEESSSEEESGSEEGSSSEEESSDEDKSPEPRQEAQKEESSDDSEEGSSSEEE